MPLNDLNVTRYPNGVGNAAINTLLSQLPFPWPVAQKVFDDDFYTFTAAQWTVTETQAGATQAIINPGNGGIVALVNSAADNDLNAIQRVAAGVTAESWGPFDGTKRFWGLFRVGVDNATIPDFVAGLQITDTTPLAVSDGFFFRKTEALTPVNFVSCKDASESVTAVGTCTTGAVAADGTQSGFMDLGFFWDGLGPTNGKFFLSFNGTVVASVQPGVASYCDNEALTLSFAVQNGTAAARTMWIDRAFVVQEL